MKLSDIVKTFATETFTDYFSSEISISCLLHVQVDATGSGSGTTRRILELPNDQSMPVSKTLTSDYGVTFIVGEELRDHNKELIRKKYPTLLATDIISVGDTGEILAESPRLAGIPANIFKVKSLSDENETSETYLEFDVRVSDYFNVNIGDVILASGDYYRVISPQYEDGAGFKLCRVVLVQNALGTVEYSYEERSQYNPVTDTYFTVTLNVPCFVEPFRVYYKYESPDHDGIEAGDKSVSFLKSSISDSVTNDCVVDPLTDEFGISYTDENGDAYSGGVEECLTDLVTPYSAKPGDTVGDRRILSVKDHGDYYTVQARRT